MSSYTVRAFLIILFVTFLVPSRCLAFNAELNHGTGGIRPFGARGRKLRTTSLNVDLKDSSHHHKSPSVQSRRSVMKNSFPILISMIGFDNATASISTENADKEKIVRGYLRLCYLVDNWEKETTLCNKGQDNPYLGCDRTPDKVMEYLGYKNMDDPLFRADKTLIRLQNLVPDNDPKAQAEYQDALDTWVEKAEEGSGMAYISSWGEANPGGGKDRVALFIERSKKDVIEARDSLATVIRILGLQVS